MPYEVRMPQLGMAQETGRLVAWLKSVGDRLTSEDPLMEVETDKTTIEVPAGADGVLAELRAAENTDVAVGHVVAVIAAEGETLSAPTPPAPEPVMSRPDPPASTAETHAPDAGRDGSTVAASLALPAASLPAGKAGRVFASPKARRLALERGMDLRELVASGAREPIHVRDLARLAGPTVARVGTLSTVTARCDSLAFERLLGRMSDESGVVIEPHVVIAGFAAAVFRPIAGGDRVVISVQTGIDGRRVSYVDPDLSRPSQPRIADEGSSPSVLIIDVTGCRITSVVAADTSLPTISIAGGSGHAFALTLTFAGAALPMADAIALTDSLGERLEAPLRHLA